MTHSSARRHARSARSTSTACASRSATGADRVRGACTTSRCRHRARRVRLPAGPVRLRQVDAARRAGRPPAAGARQLRVDGEPVAGPHPDRGLVFQQHTLFPWKTVLDNVAFGLKMKGVAARERARAARASCSTSVGLAGFEDALSGAAVGRHAAARRDRPRADQPSARAADGRAVRRARRADRACRCRSCCWTSGRACRTTVVFVTHDIDEALFLADRIARDEPAPRPRRRPRMPWPSCARCRCWPGATSTPPSSSPRWPARSTSSCTANCCAPATGASPRSPPRPAASPNRRWKPRRSSRCGTASSKPPEQSR